MKKPRVAITGMGVVTPLGNTVDDLFDNIIAKKSSLLECNDLRAEGFKNIVASRITHPELNQDRHRGRQMALWAAESAIVDSQIASSDIGIFIGTCMGESSVFESAASDRSQEISFGLGAEYASHIKSVLHLSGPMRTFGCACASGNYAIGSAAQMIQSGMVGRIVAGGVESFSRIAHLGFIRSRAMSPDRCKPFDKDRQGMQLGEAAAFLMLESEDVARERNARIYGYVGSLGLSCDVYHPTAPQPEGNGMAQAMLNALQQADLNPVDIDWLCAHGTGTKLSDTAECIAINKVFSADIPVVGIKGSLGHSLGAASAVEAVICAMALHKKCLPPTVGANNLDPQLSVNVVRDSIPFDTAQYVMNCAYGFGGVNSALILQAS